VPSFRRSPIAQSRDIAIARVACDGCDPARPCDEHTRSAALCLVAAGAFELRDRRGRHAVDPTHAMLLPANHAFAIRHPAGPDTCIAMHGPLVERIVAQHAGGSSRFVPIGAAVQVRLAELLAEPQLDELALTDTLSQIFDPVAPPAVAPDRRLADAVVHELRLRFAEQTPMTVLADRVGYSVFHTCRVFRATTGQTIQGYRRELRLRHALARILDPRGSDTLIDVAAQTGFASQSHLTNLFHARFGVTPAKARTRDGLRRIAA
jgi:AraC-like DNA-binding protein